jgi:hypothetical protein
MDDLELIELLPNLPISAPAITTRFSSDPVEAAKKLTLNPCCLWCGRAFKPRSTGGSVQKFCSTGHRQEFWIAARRWTMRAIEVGLLSVDCLKASNTSVHAA